MLRCSAIGLGISWLLNVAGFGWCTYQKHLASGQSEKFILASAGLAAMYIHALAWSQGFSLQASVVLVPPCVSFAIWMGGLWVDCHRRDAFKGAGHDGP
jgi:hypothetical protein